MVLKIKALSVVYPFGTWIAEGSKSIEVRSWLPLTLEPEEDLLIVENGRRLDTPGDTDPEGRAVVLVQIRQTRPFVEADMGPSRASCFAEGYHSWVLHRIRKLKEPFRALAARDIYLLDVAPEALEGSDGVSSL